MFWDGLWPVLAVYGAVAVIVAIVGLLRGYGRQAVWTGLAWMFHLNRLEMDAWRDRGER